MKTQIPSITSLRGIAAILVAIHHLHFKMPDFDLTQRTWFFFNSFLWVDFFFVLSGFVITHVYLKDFILGVNKKSFNLFLFSRIIRLYPLHLFIILVLVIWEITKLTIASYGDAEFPAKLFTGDREIGSLFSSLLLLQNWLYLGLHTWNPVSWSISMEFSLYLIFPFVLRQLYRGNYFNLTCKTFILILIVLVMTNLSEPENRTFYTIRSVKNIAEFFIGILTYRLYIEGVLKNLFSRDLFFLLCLLLIIIFMHSNFNYTLVIFCFPFLIIAAASNNGIPSKILNSKPLNYIGNISYSIYMLHSLFIGLSLNFSQILFGKFLSTYLSDTLSMVFFAQHITYLLIVIFVASFTYRIIEIPFRKSLKNTRFFRNP